MKERSIIRKGLAVFLLLLFMMASLPKAYFHDLVADHVDMASCDQKHSEAAVHKQSVNCHFDDLVVTGSFIPPASQSFEAVSFQFEEPIQASVKSYHFSFVQHKESRGPPAISAS